MVQGPEWRLGTQAGISLVCSCCFLCIIFLAQLQSVLGQTVLVCLEILLLGSREPSRAPNRSLLSPQCVFLSFATQLNMLIPLFPRHNTLPLNVQSPTSRVRFCSDGARDQPTNLTCWFSLRCKRPLQS